MNFKLTVRVNPNTSSRSAQWREDHLKVNLKSPPEEGRANEELIEFLSDLFNHDSQQVELINGHRNSQKTVMLHGLERETLVDTIKSLDSKN